MKVPCPFCKPKTDSLRGDGCCFCDYAGLIPEKENMRMLDPLATNTDEYPYWSNVDLKAGRRILNDMEEGRLEENELMSETDKMFQSLAECMPEEKMPQDASERVWKGIEKHLANG